MLDVNVSFEIEEQKVSKKLVLPTEVNEITPDYLNAIASEINIADDYSIIALVYKKSLSQVVNGITSKQKEVMAKVTPIFVRSGNTNSEFINAIKTAQGIVIDPSAMSLGHHLYSRKNILSVDRVCSILKSKENSKTTIPFTEVCFVELKLVPNNEIHAYYGHNSEVVSSPFGIKDDDK